MSKLSDYLEKHKIDPRRVLAASKKLEALRPEDRAIALARRKAKGNEDKLKELGDQKPRSGRPVSPATLARAMSGQPLPRKARERVVRAVNAVASQKQKGEVSAAELF